MLMLPLIICIIVFLLKVLFSNLSRDEFILLTLVLLFLVGLVMAGIATG
jgi:hypothetical protein